MRARTLISAGLATAAVAAFAAPASAAVTIGSDLTTPGPYTNNNCGTPCTTMNVALIPANQAQDGLTSPVNGTITSFSVVSGSSGNVSLRVLRPNGGLSYTGVGTSPLLGINIGLTTRPVSLPIQIGDSIGLDNPADHLVIGTNPGATQLYWTIPPLADGTPRSGTAGGGNETMVQAVVEPSNTVTLGKLKLKKSKGTATLDISVPNAGQLAFSGSGVKVTGVTSTNAPADIRLTIKAKGKKKSALEDNGKVTVKPKITFTPNNGTAAAPVVKKVKLKKS